MRRPIVIAGTIVGALIVVVAALLLYAAANLNTIIAQNRDLLLAKFSSSLGRPVQVAKIQASIGFGVSADISGLKIGDDPSFSDQPFLRASDIYARLELFPLLVRQVRISKVVLQNPEIRVIRNARGVLNVSTIGRTGGEQMPPRQQVAPPEPSAPSAGTPMETVPAQRGTSAGILGALHVSDFAVEQGKILYAEADAAPIRINAVDLEVSHFGFTSPFDLKLRLAALGDDQNVDVSGQVGPLSGTGALDLLQTPFDLHLKLGPVALDALRKVAMAGNAIPAKLSITDPFSLEAAAKGKPTELALDVSSDLTSNALGFGDAFNKPANLPLKISAHATVAGPILTIDPAEVTLSDLQLKATKVSPLGGFSGRIDTNRFDLGSLAKVLPALASSNVTGQAEIHTDAEFVGGKLTANGMVALAQVAVSRPGQATPVLSNLGGEIKLNGTAADAGQLKFDLGSGHATLEGHAESVYPPSITYKFSTDSLKTGELAAGRPADEQLSQLMASGTLISRDNGLHLDSKVTSPAGRLNNIDYNKLDLTLSLEGTRARAEALRVGVFGGTVVATADTHLEPKSPFRASVSFSGLDLQQAIQSQNPKAAGTVRGFITGRITANGVTGKFDEMKPTFDGDGQLLLQRGKLVGVNVVADSLRKVQNVPGIGNLMPDAVVRNHPELFQNHDTDIDSMTLTFVLKGPRITSHDISVKSVDYAMQGDGWFDMDKNINLAARIQLSKQLSGELVQQKKNIVYVTNNDGQVDFPLHISGALPKPLVVPDAAEIAQRAGTRALEEKGQKAIGKLFGKKGLGGLLGGDSNSGAPSGKPTPSNPLEQLKKLF